MTDLTTVTAASTTENQEQRGTSDGVEVPGARPVRPDAVILDGKHDYLGAPWQVRTVIKGDQSCVAVAAASVIAKVTRDRFMVRMEERYPGWEFAAHVGYSTPEHRAAIERLGVSPLHRMSFQSMAYQQLAL